MSAEADVDHTTDQIPEWKREEVDELVSLIQSYQSIGIVDITGIPSRQLQAMRRDLHGSAELRVSRNTLLVRALDEVDDGVEQLTEEVSGQVGLIGTDENPFGLYRQLEASKTPAPISAGEVTPNDIVIPAGDTGVDPGPFVGELQQVGADARIEGSSIEVMSESNVLDAGKEVSAELEGVLSELGIEPKEVGLDLRTVYSEGVLFDPEELAIDIEEYRTKIQSAASAGRNLSINAVYPTSQTADALVSKASTEARSLGVFAAIESPDIAEDLVSKADAKMRALAAVIDDDEALPEELRGAELTPEPAESTEEESTDEESDADAETAEDADEDDEDDDGGAEGLGAMFG